MPRFCANLTMLYNEHGFLDRFAAARADGFAGVEFMFPYAFPKEQLADALHQNGLTQVLHNLPAGNWEGGERGIACLPDRTGEFQDGVGRAIDYARALGCRQLNCLVGLTPQDADADRVRQTLVDNLRFAAGHLGEADIRLLVEPVNSKDIPGFHLDRVEKVVATIDEVGSDNVFLQYDFYHQQRMAGELLATFRTYKDRIAHIQIADNPGRNEPGTGEINYPVLFEALDREGYAGWTGCEYKPKAETSAGSGLVRALSHRARIRHLRRSEMKVGFIGLGIMGAPMAGHLIKGGHELYLQDPAASSGRSGRGGRDRMRFARRGGREGRRDHHHGPGHAGCRAGSVRACRRRGGAFPRQDDRRHELDLACCHQGFCQADQRARLRLSRRAGFWR